MPITLTLDIAEVNGLLQVLGELPTKTGAFTLMTKIQQQAQPQVPAEPAAVTEAPAE